MNETTIFVLRVMKQKVQEVQFFLFESENLLSLTNKSDNTNSSEPHSKLQKHREGVIYSNNLVDYL